MKPFTRHTGVVAVLPQGDIDTDQIIPARFLSTTVREGLGPHCFFDWRYDPEGRERADFPLHRPATRDASILLAGRNFGCGSSREHASWALLDLGIRVVVSSRIADIFRSNALKNGLLPIEVGEDDWRKMAAHEGRSMTVDLERGVIEVAGDTPVAFEVEAFARECLLRGVDQLGYLLAAEADIAAYEAGAPS